MRPIELQKAADAERDGHYLAYRDALHVDDVVCIQHGERAALIDLAGDLFHKRLRQRRHAERRQVTEAQFEDARRQGELAFLAHRVAEMLERHQQAPRHGA